MISRPGKEEGEEEAQEQEVVTENNLTHAKMT